jgi:hypothetical protein
MIDPPDPKSMPFWKWCLLMEDLRMIDALNHMEEICPSVAPMKIIISTPNGPVNKFWEMTQRAVQSKDNP